MTNPNLTQNEIEILSKLVPKANNNDKLISYLQPSDLKYSDSNIEERLKFKSVMNGLKEKGVIYFTFLDSDKCRIENLKIDDEIYDIINQMIQDGDFD